MPNTTLMVASSDEHFREMVRDNLINLPDAMLEDLSQEQRLIMIHDIKEDMAYYLADAPSIATAEARPARGAPAEGQPAIVVECTELGGPTLLFVQAYRPRRRLRPLRTSGNLTFVGEGESFAAAA